jgi:hypothetical protein
MKLEPLYLGIRTIDSKITHHWNELGLLKYQPPNVERIYIKYIMMLKKDFEKAKKMFER